MNADQLDHVIRDVLHDWTPDKPAASTGVADRILRRRRRRNTMRVAGAVLGIAGITIGTVLTTNGTGHEAAPSPASGMSTESKLLWRTTLPTDSWDACTLGPGAVYCRGSAYDAIGLDVRNGKIDWQRKSGDPHGGSTPSGSLAGTRNGVLYTYADHSPGADMAGTDLVAVDVESHKVLWRHKMADDSRDEFAAVRFDGGILANTPTFKSVAALDDRTGRTLWTYKWKQADCDPASIGGVPYLVCSPDSDKSPKPSSVVRLDPKTGEARTVATVKGMTMHIGTDGDTVLLGGLAGGQKFFSDPGPATLTRVDTGSGKVTQHRVDGIPMGKVVDGRILPGGGDTAVARSAQDGRRMWSRDLGLTLREDLDAPMAKELTSDAAVDLGRRVAYYLDPTGHMVGVDLDSGAVRWRGAVELPKRPVRAGIAPELMVSGHSLVGQVDGQIFRIEPQLKEAGS
ncbi:PQQ-binding-like beta-propeller repeat protein [Streptomyces sp. SID8379]|uniref:outer membrane protein assembly factor BamB family protein n=1 Tax=unclassified Streptomyces TaxID=2593676 RepID=UPI00036DEE9F|nr:MULTISPECIES: PQQ-binding-like beta-propeller repeat protein [unclassified Streptomyces]MYW63002.1 PQQ-binding-like beta-propeller repeat protein [Streptomyces sp. SID8379]